MAKEDRIMPRGDNPNSRANLIPNQNLSSDKVRERGSKGGKKSAEVRRAKATLTEALKEKCTPEVLDQLTDMLVKRAKQGNLKAFELLRDQIGEKPSEKITINQVDSTKVSEIEELINGINTGTE